MIFQYLADLVDPELADPRAGRVQGVVLLTATRGPGGQGELTGVFWVLLQTQPAHLGRVGREGVKEGERWRERRG